MPKLSSKPLRTILPLVLAILTGCSPQPPGPGSAGDAPAPAVEARPDIVLIVVDTLRADHLGLYGYARPTSPHVDAWASRGLVFDRAYSHSGWTLASVTSLLTGLLPNQHGVGRDARDPTCFGRLPDEVETLPERLQQAGYSTAAFVNNTFLAPEFGLKQGFDHWDWRGSTETEIRSADDTVSAALAWLQTQQRPTFLLVHVMEPHTLYQPAPDLLGTFSSLTPVPPDQVITEKTIASWQTYRSKPSPAQAARAVALYDEEILTVDRALSTLFDGLATRARADQTLTVLTADHGEEFWDHGGFEHGQSLMGELTHVPLVVVGPGVEPGRVRTVVGHSDLTRALEAVAGLRAQPGGDLLALARLGPYAGPRYVISENTLYGPPRMSVVGDMRRLDVRQDTMKAVLWEVMADGSEPRQVQTADLSEEMRPLQAALLAGRGNLDMPVGVAGGQHGCAARVSDHDVFMQLQALGYLDERPDVPIDQPIDQPVAPGGPAGSGE